MELINAEFGPMRVAADIHQQMAKKTVHQPRWARMIRSSVQIQLGKSDLQVHRGCHAGPRRCAAADWWGR